jgi:biopolymer transport protein ExbD
MRRPNRGPEILSTINVTPIIDVALVLVIILLVTAPMMSASDLPVRLPTARTRGAEDQRNLSVTLGSDGSLAVDDQRVAPSALRAAVGAKLAQPGEANVLVVIRADADAPYARVRTLLADVRAAGAQRLAIATRQDAEVTR